jgi:single-strand DNA-binding protein
MNHTTFTARLTRDPELRQVGAGKTKSSVLTLRVAIDDRQRSDERPAIFLDVDCWGQLAETASKHLAKGSMVGITGRLDREEWQAAEGVKRERLYVVASAVDFLSPRRDRDAAQPSTVTA